MRLTDTLRRPERNEPVHWPGSPLAGDHIEACHAGAEASNLWLVSTVQQGWTLIRWTYLGWTVDQELTASIREVEGRPLPIPSGPPH